MATARIRFTATQGFVLPGGNGIFVTNKYSILSGPLEWLAPIGLGSLRLAMEQSGDDNAQALYISRDPPDRFDGKYPNHILDVRVEYSESAGRMAVAVSHERPTPDELDKALEDDLKALLAGPMKRHGGSNFRLK